MSILIATKAVAPPNENVKKQKKEYQRYAEERADQIGRLKVNLIDHLKSYSDTNNNLSAEELENILDICYSIDYWLDSSSKIGELERKVYKKQLEKNMEDIYQKKLNAYEEENVGYSKQY